MPRIPIQSGRGAMTAPKGEKRNVLAQDTGKLARPGTDDTGKEFVIRNQRIAPQHPPEQLFIEQRDPVPVVVALDPRRCTGPEFRDLLRMTHEAGQQRLQTRAGTLRIEERSAV